MAPKSAAAAALAAGVAAAVAGAGCGRDGHAETSTETLGVAHRAPQDTAASASPAECSHAACGDDFFVDAEPPAACAPGATCTLALTVVATGAFHLNDAYPYKFRADEQPGVEFLGKGESGHDVFSKTADDWTKKDEKRGTMAVTFRTGTVGVRVLSGTFKLSVCSAEKCELEQRPVRAPVTVR